MSAFGMFHDSEVIIERAVNAGSYSGDTKYEEVCRIHADVQPYSKAGTLKEYGIFCGAQLVMYYDGTEDLQDSMRAVAGGKRFVIMGAEKRRMGNKYYLKEDVE